MKTQWPDYDKRAADCVAFVKANWPKSVQRAIFNSDEKWYWRNGDGDFFTFDSEEAACADFCLETGVTIAELDRGKAA